MVRLAVGMLALSAWSVAAQEAAPVAVELNKLEAGDRGCQAWLVARNAGAVAHDSLRLDVVLFDADGVVGKRLAVDVGPLPPGKTIVKAFVAEGLDCSAIGSALLNDVLSCGGAGSCLDTVQVSARPPLVFTK